jgi:hypothetical protein
MKQSEMSAINQTAWNTGAYEAWVIENGTPTELAAKLEPEKVLKRVLKHLGNLNNKKVANPLGSRGRIEQTIRPRACECCKRQARVSGDGFHGARDTKLRF